MNLWSLEISFFSKWTHYLIVVSILFNTSSKHFPTSSNRCLPQSEQSNFSLIFLSLNCSFSPTLFLLYGKVEILSTILLTLFCTKFTCILAISNHVFKWESYKGSVWESVKKCSRFCKEARTCDWILRVTRGLQAARSYTRAKHAKSWRVTPTVVLQDKSPRLARPLARCLNSQLNPVVRPSRQNTLFGKN